MRLSALFIPLMLAACVEELEIPDGRASFMENCAGCHGVDGKGSGPLVTGVGLIAADLTMISARKGGTFPRQDIMAIIDGLDRDPHFSNAMPEFGAGDLGEAVIVEGEDGLGTPTPVGLIALADYLESIQEL
ncbi:MAG: cytochrome c [Yoonia sp.]|uniref:c-type cytochrome n=1 Tax=Yoonia sp. TaxID=2212373 RepID=UPI003266DF54